MEEARAVDVLVAAFHDDPVQRWLFPGDRAGDAARQVFRPLVGRAAGAGGLDGVDGVAVAVWFGLAAGADPFDGDGGDLPAALRPYAGRLAVFAELVGARHPTGRSHLYLLFLGVVPHRRGGGSAARCCAAGSTRRMRTACLRTSRRARRAAVRSTSGTGSRRRATPSCCRTVRPSCRCGVSHDHDTSTTRRRTSDDH